MRRTVFTTVSTERVEIEMDDETQAVTATLFLGDRKITAATVQPLTGGWACGTEAIFSAIAGLLRHGMATCPFPIRPEAVNAGRMVYVDEATNAKADKS